MSADLGSWPSATSRPEGSRQVRLRSPDSELTRRIVPAHGLRPKESAREAATTAAADNRLPSVAGAQTGHAKASANRGRAPDRHQQWARVGCSILPLMGGDLKFRPGHTIWHVDRKTVSREENRLRNSAPSVVSHPARVAVDTDCIHVARLLPGNSPRLRRGPDAGRGRLAAARAGRRDVRIAGWIGVDHRGDPRSAVGGWNRRYRNALRRGPASGGS